MRVITGATILPAPSPPPSHHRQQPPEDKSRQSRRQRDPFLPKSSIALTSWGTWWRRVVVAAAGFMAAVGLWRQGGASEAPAVVPACGEEVETVADGAGAAALAWAWTQIWSRQLGDGGSCSAQPSRLERRSWRLVARLGIGGWWRR